MRQLLLETPVLRLTLLLAQLLWLPLKAVRPLHFEEESEDAVLAAMLGTSGALHPQPTLQLPPMPCAASAGAASCCSSGS